MHWPSPPFKLSGGRIVREDSGRDPQRVEPLSKVDVEKCVQISILCLSLALCSSSNFATLFFPSSTATCNAVLPCLSSAITSAPLSGNGRTTSRRPLTSKEAKCKGVEPFSTRAFISAQRSSSRRIISSLAPWYEALCNGVQPSFARTFTSAPCSSSNR